MTGLRKLGSAVLIIVGGIVLVCGILARYADQNLLDPEAFADSAVEALDDESVHAEIRDVIVNELERRGAERAEVRPLVDRGIAELAADERFRERLNAALVVASKSILEADRKDVTVQIEDVGVTLREVLGKRDPELARMIPPDLDLPVVNASSAGSLIDAAQAADGIASASLLLAILGGVLMSAGVVVANDRRTALFGAAMGVALSGAATFAIYIGGREVVALQPEDEPAQDATRAIWSSVFGELQVIGLVMAGAGALVALVAGVAFRGRR
jgi:hypothetical protein